MKRILLLVTLASMLAAAMAISGVAQAASTSAKADAQCEKLAIQTLGPGFNPANYTIRGGTAGDDNFSYQGISGPVVWCGFGGNDSVGGGIGAGEYFLGGAGNDSLPYNNGTFYGGAGNDSVDTNYGTFYGGDGDDSVTYNYTVTGSTTTYDSGTFYGGDGDDSVDTNWGTFYGGDGDDDVYYNAEATAYHSAGNFYGGDGIDTVGTGTPPVDGPSGT